MVNISHSPRSVCVVQANTFDMRRNQQGFFTYLHKWIIVAKHQSQLDDIEFFLGNVSNVVAVVLRNTAHPIQQVLINLVNYVIKTNCFTAMVYHSTITLRRTYSGKLKLYLKAATPSYLTPKALPKIPKNIKIGKCVRILCKYMISLCMAL